GSTIVPKNPSRPAPGKDIPASTSGDARPNARKTVRTIAFQLLFWGLTGPVMFPVTALLTHYLGPDQYGEYSFTLPFLAICALLSGTGMDQLIIRRLSHLPRERWSEHLSYAAGSRLLSTGMSIVSICLLALLLPLDSELRNMLMLGTLSLFFSYSFNGWRSIFTHGFRAEQKTTVLIVLESVNRLITACVVVLVVLLHLPLLWAYVLIIYSDLPCFLVQVFIARRRFGIRIRFSLPWMRKHLLGSLSLTGYDALALITNQADILLLEWFTGSAQVGLYALALRISDPLLAMAFTFMNGLYPLLCSTFEKGRAEFARLYHEAIRILSLALLPLSIFVSMEASAIVRLLGGERFASADIIVQLLFWATAIIFYSQLAVQSCMAANMERKIPYVAGVGTVVNILGNLILIPLYQAVGASVASLISEMLSLILFTVLLRRHVAVLRTCLVVLQVFLGNLPMLAFLWWQQQASLLLTIPVSVALAIAGSIAVRALTWRDVLLVRRFLFSRGIERSSETGSRDPRSYSDRNSPPIPVFTDFQDVSNCPTLILPRIRV
ncbi:MAG: flippase, partial [Ktedonobacteraceae bacterium]|nr:flippase [Ktedonobacteraceae bacterium]